MPGRLGMDKDARNRKHFKSKILGKEMLIDQIWMSPESVSVREEGEGHFMLMDRKQKRQSSPATTPPQSTFTNVTFTMVFHKEAKHPCLLDATGKVHLQPSFPSLQSTFSTVTSTMVSEKEVKHPHLLDATGKLQLTLTSLTSILSVCVCVCVFSIVIILIT